MTAGAEPAAEPDAASTQNEPAKASDPWSTQASQSAGADPCSTRNTVVPAAPPASTASRLPVIPGYLIRGVLGRGGMGIVFDAYHEKLRRRVALKMILGGGHGPIEHHERFLAEARAVAKLAHPHVVAVYEIGDHADGPYFSLEFVEGGSLDRRLAGAPQPPREAAKLLLKLARATQAAHDEGIVHRDLKPANILLTTQGEPKITDFGLAKQIDLDSSQTKHGSVLGTPSYMAPEQAAGLVDQVGPAADVHALGAILYEMLTGRPPFRGPTVVDTLDQVRNQEPVPPARLQPGIPRDLESICLKCLEKEVRRRYVSAKALGDDLARFLGGRPVHARPAAAWERVLKWTRRHRAYTALIALALLAVLGGTIGYLVYLEDLRTTEASTRAYLLVRSLSTADIAAVPHLVAELEPYRHWAEPLLREELARQPADSPGHLHASLALLPHDDRQLDGLTNCLLRARARELPVLREALAGHAEVLRPKLWSIVDNDKAPSAMRLRAAAALAAYSPDDPCWQRHAPFLARKILAENTLDVGRWAELFEPVRGPLLEPFVALNRDPQLGAAERALVTGILADYATDRPAVVAALILDASPEQYGYFFPILAKHKTEAVRLLGGELHRSAAIEQPRPDRQRRLKQQALAAVTLYRLGVVTEVWPLLRHTPDPTVRSYLIHLLGRLDADPLPILHRFEEEADVSVLRSLVLSLGEFDEERLPVEQRTHVAALLLRWYVEHPDPGLHSAIDWLLRHSQQGPRPRKLDWARADALSRLDRQLAQRPPGQRNWFLTRQGHTLAIVREPQEFWMGSPSSEPDRIDSMEARHRRRIPRSFAIATREVSVAQFRRFLTDNQDVEHSFIEKYSPHGDGPITTISWFQAARYCNWLSKMEGIPKDQWCFPETIEEGMELPAGYLTRSGYRLPTEAEWEYACRAGAQTTRFFGLPEELLPEFAWYAQTTNNARTWLGGQTKPNDFGLFDLYGNVNEWCMDRARPYEGDRGEVLLDVEDEERGVHDRQARVARGGAFDTPGADLRSAMRIDRRPGHRTAYFGFRVARTVPR